MARRGVPTFDELYRSIASLPEGLTGEILEPGEIRTMARPGNAETLASGAPETLDVLAAGPRARNIVV
jgi:hypothetical protein